MTGADYKKALDAAVDELEALLQQQEEIAGRILSLRKTVVALSTLCEESGEKADWKQRASSQLLDTLEGTTITEDILRVIHTSNTPMTTTMIKDQLDLIGTLDRHKNPLATINAVLGRLKEQGKVREIISGNKKLWVKKGLSLKEIVSKAPPPITPLC